MEDAGIIELLFARSEQGIRELDAKYGGTCRRLSYNIVNDWQDAEECVNDAYLGAWNAIPPARYYTAYDHTKTFMNDGYTEQYFYLTRDARTGKWGIAENTAPDTGARP